MSYCRWSSDDFQCDVYCYADCGGGWMTHVACRRHVFSGPLPPSVGLSDVEAWLDRHNAVMRMLDDATLVDIGGPYDGETFNDPTPQEAADTLEMLRAAGYNVPQYAIDELRAEATAGASPAGRPQPGERDAMSTLTIDDLILAHGSHGAEFCGEACAVEVSNLIAAGKVVVPSEWAPPCPLEPAPFGDDHPSISRVIRAFTIGLNDAWNDTDRQRLKPYAAKILCTATTETDEETRAWMATDWLVRVHTPAFLRLGGLEEHARALESLAPLVDATTARTAQPSINAARDRATAAWDAARDAAGDAAWDAARAAARAALRPTVEALQESALRLLDEMIAVSRKPAGAS